jgi:hypothetical protein
MAYFDPADYLDEISTAELRAELKKREAHETDLIRRGLLERPVGVNKTTEAEQVSREICNEISDYLRRQGLIRWANDMEEVRDKFVLKLKE